MLDGSYQMKKELKEHQKVSLVLLAIGKTMEGRERQTILVGFPLNQFDTDEKNRGQGQTESYDKIDFFGNLMISFLV